MSEIVSEAGFKLITFHLPPLVKMQEWKLIFSIDRDGVDMGTFYNRVEEHEESVIMIETEENDVIGAFMTD